MDAIKKSSLTESKKNKEYSIDFHLKTDKYDYLTIWYAHSYNKLLKHVKPTFTIPLNHLRDFLQRILQRWPWKLWWPWNESFYQDQLHHSFKTEWTHGEWPRFRGRWFLRCLENEFDDWRRRGQTKTENWVNDGQENQPWD